MITRNFPHPPYMTTSTLTLQNLVSSKENFYKIILLVFSILVWLAIAVSFITIIPIFIVLVIAFLMWIANGLLIAHLRSEGVKVTSGQMPQLDTALRDACHQLGYLKIPDMYILQSGGILNAFATRFAGKNFIVLYSEIVEAYGPDSAQIRFIIGHELGHIIRQHVLMHLLLAPGMLLPLIGCAYRRSCETTCDRFGTFVSDNADASVDAMLRLAGGKTLGSYMQAEKFAQQHESDRGFFVSWHELSSGYPTLSQRVHQLLGIKEGRERPQGARNFLAYFFAFLMPGGSPIFLIILLYFAIIFGAMVIPALAHAEKTVAAEGAHLLAPPTLPVEEPPRQEHASEGDTTPAAPEPESTP